MIETNLYSAYHLTRVIVPKMQVQMSGHIFNMSSIAGLQAYKMEVLTALANLHCKVFLKIYGKN